MRDKKPAEDETPEAFPDWTKKKYPHDVRDGSLWTMFFCAALASKPDRTASGSAAIADKSMTQWLKRFGEAEEGDDDAEADGDDDAKPARR